MKSKKQLITAYRNHKQNPNSETKAEYEKAKEQYLNEFEAFAKRKQALVKKLVRQAKQVNEELETETAFMSTYTETPKEVSIFKSVLKRTQKRLKKL